MSRTSRHSSELTLDAIRSRLRSLLPELRDRHAVATLEIFGSWVRGAADADSDLDLLVSFSEPPDLLELIAVEHLVADRLGIPVDLVLRHSLKPRVAERVLAEAVPI